MAKRFFESEEKLNNSWSVYRKDRNFLSTNCSRGGGVLLAVKNNWSSIPVITITCHFLDHLFIKINLGTNYLYLDIVYFPPNSDNSTYLGFYDICNNIIAATNEDDL